MKPREDGEDVAMNKTSKDLSYPNMTQDEPERVKEIRERALKATPGPWSVDYYSASDPMSVNCVNAKIGGTTKLFDMRGWGYLTGGGHGALGLPRGEAIAIQDTNAKFVAHAREDIPYLLSLLSVSEKRAEEAERLYAQICDAMDRSQSHLRGAIAERDSSQASLLRVRDEGHTDTQVFFYERDFYPLSNFSAFRLRWRGRDFDTSEAAYHWERFATGQDTGDRSPAFGSQAAAIADDIRFAASAHEAFKIAQEFKAHQRPDWDAVKVGVMRNILRAKADQHEYVRRKLLATGDRKLIENSWRDDFWGWGPNKDGKNMLGKLWMEIRTALSPHTEK